ncbi:MAG: hypothetical protein AVDCRST_MAG11-1713, partial [uncultured Gemmatimonadaceae bacterium]
ARVQGAGRQPGLGQGRAHHGAPHPLGRGAPRLADPPAARAEGVR